ncbi:restriction endonuclease subunit R, partial [Candidatus Poribacteria bacterium]|nr:restriction endonuclease subunit R [Candidatus Poribacteria bacterium]
RQAVIENPILNSPFETPERHFRFSDDGITDEIEESRRRSSYFMPIPKAKKRRGAQAELLGTEWTQDRIAENRHVNEIRQRVHYWRQRGYPDVTRTTKRLIEHWTHPQRERRLFYCQIEAIETAVYIAEAARRQGDAWIENFLRDANADANPELFRIAPKMATGTGKTAVMAMLIAWHVLNKQANTRDRRFSDAFLIVTPGITIRDRLRVLLPNDTDNYYRALDIVPSEQRDALGQAKIVITNFHAFLPREKTSAAKLTKTILSQGGESPFRESPDEMARRVCRGLGSKRNVIVINDEAHHCYRRRADAEDEKLKGDERKEAQKRDEEARVWISGLEAVRGKIGVKTVYDLSATPFFLRGSGYPEGTLFPWVVSDFSLIDAIESGIVKVPRVPVADDAMVGEQPTYRDLWIRIRDDLPRKGRKTDALHGDPVLPAELEGALQSLYSNYETYYRKWEAEVGTPGALATPPVFIVVCNNTNVSKLVYDYVGGWARPMPDGSSAAVPGKLDIFSNEENGTWRARSNTILVDSQQLESGEAMSREFKSIATREIEEFKNDYRLRFPGRDADSLTDEDLLREVMNTVGKPGKLGEHVRCVVSVSMLTEGWDANTVTHILGVRAFGTQLLCEQVVGRGLRRMSYVAEPRTVDVDGRTVEFDGFAPEYAEVYGVPFSFIPSSGSADPPPTRIPTRVRALDERVDCEINFPRVVGYRYDLPSERLAANFTDDSTLVVSPQTTPTRTDTSSIIGESMQHRMYGLEDKRLQTVAFKLAETVCDTYFRDDDKNPKPWLFPQALRIAREWMESCVTYKDNAYPQMLLLAELTHDAADRIYRAIAASAEGEKALRPILRPYDTVGSTRYVDFDTTRPMYTTRADKCHVSHVVADTESWEQKMAQTLEDMDEVVHYVKNHSLGFTIPYTMENEERSYIPDFILHVDDGHADLLNLIVEVSGEARKDKAAKVATARNLWVPAVNNHGQFGRWAFVEISDPWDAMGPIRGVITSEAAPRIRRTEGVCGGSARVRDTRIPVWTLIRCAQLDMTEAEILGSYPGLSTLDISAASAYYVGHRLEIDREIRSNEKDA